MTAKAITRRRGRKASPRSRKVDRRTGRKPGALPPALVMPPSGVTQGLIAHLRSKDGGVIGGYIGSKCKSGRNTGEIGLVVFVRRKVAPQKLRKERFINPTLTFELRAGGPRCSIATDVQALSPKRMKTQQLVLGPGDALMSALQETGTLGIVIDLPNGVRVVTTAAHAVTKLAGTYDWSSNPLSVNLFTMPGKQRFQGLVMQTVLEPFGDYAYVMPEDAPPAANLFQDTYRIAPPRGLVEADINEPAWLLHREGFSETAIRGINGEAEIDGLYRTGLIFTDRVSLPGDSGGLLIDNHWRAIGLLIGRYSDGPRSFSVFMNPAITLEGVATWV